MKTLSLNGGGSKGYMSLYILSKLEEEFSNEYKTYQLFDIIGGVSSGSIIGALLSKGYSAKESLELYRTFIPHIFSNKRCLVSSMFRSKYDNEPLKKLMKEYLGHNIKESKTRFMTYAVSIGEEEVKPKFWKSWEDSVMTYDACMASSAIPTYLDPYKVDGKYYIDGGLASNNPSMCVIAEALRVGASMYNLYNVNITCGSLSGYDKPGKIRGLVDWITKITDVNIHAVDRTEEYQAHTLLGFRNHFIQPKCNLPPDSTDFKAMESAAEEVWKVHKDALIENIAPDR